MVAVCHPGPVLRERVGAATRGRKHEVRERMSAQETTAAAAGLLRVGDKQVARMGFGAMRLSGPNIWGPPADVAAAKQVLRRALELDVTFIDTAHAYGPEANERLIGDTLHPYGDSLVIATKVGSRRNGPGEWYQDGRPEALRADCERSLALLKLDTIDVLQLHAVDATVPIEESVGTLAELQREGKVRHLGVSNVDLDQLRRAQAVAKLVSVQNRYSVLHRADDDVLTHCEREGLAFIPWFPLSAGEVGKDARLDRIAQRHGVSPWQTALAWLLDRSPAMLPIPGTSSVTHLEANVAAAGIQLTRQDRIDLAALSGGE
jgi:aryl-alcohol dehydrogenase-like predicted oxidoreductase